MRWLFMFMAIAGLCAPIARASDVNTDRQAVLKAVKGLDSALLAKDARALGALLEPDFIGTVPSGMALSRDAYVAFHTRPNEGLVAVETAAGTEPTVRVYEGRFAVVNRRLAVRRNDPEGKVEAFEVQRIEVLRLDDGHWRIVSGQGTRLQH
jgi:hypothetical protein